MATLAYSIAGAAALALVTVRLTISAITFTTSAITVTTSAITLTLGFTLVIKLCDQLCVLVSGHSTQVVVQGSILQDALCSCRTHTVSIHTH